MLKKVVLPAPLGPMIETIERSGIAKVTSSTATRPPKTFETFAAQQRLAVGRGGHARLSQARLVDRRPTALSELELAPALGQEALRAQHHHEHQQEAEDPERELGEVEVEPDLRGHVVEHVGDQVGVDVRQHTAPSTTPQMLPSPPRMTIARMKIEKPNWNWSALTVFRNEPRKAPEMPPKAAPVA